jgi:gamma-glutamylcyclotransferase (GGCT)/AIG2-like uncharacterized protein YtfP
MVFYFAYGADMDLDTLSKRLGEQGPDFALTPRQAALSGYRLAFNKPAAEWPDAGYANLVPDRTNTVHGSVYELLPANVENLTRLNTGYEAVSVKVTLGTGEQRAQAVDALAFVAKDGVVDDTRLPTREHLQTLLGARSLLPEDYAAALTSWPTVESDEMVVPERLSQSSRAALAHADRLRQGAGKSRVHMEHLIQGLFQKPNGPTRLVLGAFNITDDNSLAKALEQASDDESQ